MTAPVFNLNENVPYPPRYWWTRRIAAASLGILLAIVGAWGVWWKTASDRLWRQIHEIESRGEPIWPQQFNPPAVPDEQNVAEFINSAGAAVSTTVDSPRASNMAYEAYPPMSAEWYSMARSALAANTRPLLLVRQARQFSKVDWKLAVKTPVFNVLLPMLNQQRNLANLVLDVALYEHLMGDDFEALEHLQDVFQQAHAIDEQPFLVSHLVAIGIHALALQDVIVIAPGLRFADDPSPAATTQPVKPARREQVQALIKLLLERAIQDRMTRVLQAERMGEVDEIDWLSKRSLLLKPMYRRDLSNLLDAMQPIVAAASQPNLPAAQAPMTGTPGAARGSTPGWTNMMSQTFMPSLNRAAETDFRVRAEAAMAAVVLAGRLYQVDHAGKWPANLDALVPQYLPSVPTDPMSSTAKPLGYIILNNGTRPLVYSVGPDDYDDTTKGAIPSPVPHVDYGSTADQWRDLSRFTPPQAATTPSGN